MLDIIGLNDPEPSKTKTRNITNKNINAQNFDTAAANNINSLNNSASSKTTCPSSTSQVKKITKLISSIRDPNRVNVFINDKFSFSLDVNQIIDLQIKVGQILSEADLQKLQSASEFGKLYQRALEWALTRPHSVRETQDYLKRRQLKRQQLNKRRAQEKLKPLPEIKTETTQLVLKRLIERKYIDDYHFTEFYLENRSLKKGSSMKRLKTELFQKGISHDIIDEVLANSERNEADELRKMIIKKRQKYDDQKLIAYLVRQGFNYQMVKDAVESFPKTD